MNTIIDPTNNKSYSIFSKNGKRILKNYLNALRGGSGKAAAKAAGVKLYRTLDNGGTAFFVKVNLGTKTVRVYSYSTECIKATDEGDEVGDDIPVESIQEYVGLIEEGAIAQGNLLYELGYKKMFVGQDPAHGHDGGNNSLLFLIGSSRGMNTYVHIGTNVQKFTTPDVILSYSSPVGNSSVAYPYATGEEITILMAENVSISNDKLGRKDPYDYYYKITEDSGINCGIRGLEEIVPRP